MRRFGKGFKTVTSCTMTGGRKKENAVSLRRKLKLKNGKEKIQTQKKEKKD
tara:strand:+ start:458 stop:610 length:153 start_codon:yes stop_codon:yes gene_type:complete